MNQIGYFILCWIELKKLTLILDTFNKKVLVGIVVTRYSYNIRIDVFKSLDIKKVINLSIYIHIDAYMLTKLLGKFTEYFDF